MIPWQERKQIGFFKALFETIKQVLFRPGEFFENVETQRSRMEPLYFFVIVNMLVAVISLTFNYFFMRSADKMPAMAIVFVILVIPLGLAIAIYLGTGIMHLFVLLFRGTGGFNATFNVFAYTAAANLFSIIPLIGGLISVIWGLVVGVIGYKRLHQMGTFRAIMAYAGIIIIAVIFLLAAIAIPGLLRARIHANETSAIRAVKTLTVAVEKYKIDNDKYPEDEFALKYSQPPYINETYNDKAVNGYKYSVKFMPDGYEIAANPEKCGTTGERIFRATPGKDISFEEKCYNATATK